MIEYPLVKTLLAVVETGSFQNAARSLLLTQSAVSQRVQAIEDRFGAPLVRRTMPPRLTALGEVVVTHYRQVAAMEEDLLTRVGLHHEAGTPLTIPIAVNTESLATWFWKAVLPAVKEHSVLLQLRIADQDKTADILKKGSVFASVSSLSETPPGCHTQPLGAMIYRCVAAPDFKKRFFPDGITLTAIASAPAVLYDETDRLQEEFLSRALRTTNLPRLHYHYVPSPDGILQCIRGGVGYGVVPEVLMGDLIKKQQLIDLFPEKPLRVRLYWHALTTKSEILKDIHHSIVQAARKQLGDLTKGRA